MFPLFNNFINGRLLQGKRLHIVQFYGYLKIQHDAKSFSSFYQSFPFLPASSHAFLSRSCQPALSSSMKMRRKIILQLINSLKFMLQNPSCMIFEGKSGEFLNKASTFLRSLSKISGLQNDTHTPGTFTHTTKCPPHLRATLRSTNTKAAGLRIQMKS